MFPDITPLLQTSRIILLKLCEAKLQPSWVIHGTYLHKKFEGTNLMKIDRLKLGLGLVWVDFLKFFSPKSNYHFTGGMGFKRINPTLI